ncbi:MAG: hypothetical protein WCH40_12705 [Verrucomicrobiales bacterium]
MLAEERLRVSAGNRESIEIRDQFKAVETAANAEDLDAYVECFSERLRKPLRHRIGMLFVKHEISMEILDSHVLESSELSAQVAVKYRARLSGRSYDVVSILGMIKEYDHWRINKETIHSTQRIDSDRTASCGSACGMKQFQFGGGQAGGNLPLNWDPFNPPAHLIDPALEHLRGDIGIMPGRGCAAGRCGQPGGLCR